MKKIQNPGNMKDLWKLIPHAWQWRHRRAVRIDDDDDNDEGQSRAENADETSWQRYMDLSGAVYWHEPLTSRFRWDEDYAMDENSASSSASLWISCVDEASGRGYFHNTQTGESRWATKEEEKDENY